MSVRLFVGYFVALAACSTLAFTQFGPDSTASVPYPMPDPPYSRFYLSQPYLALPDLALPAVPGRHRHKAIRLPLQFVAANLVSVH